MPKVLKKYKVRSQLLDQEIFEALDQDNSASSDYFIEKYHEVVNDELVRLHDNHVVNEGPHTSSQRCEEGISLHGLYDHADIAVILLEADASLLSSDVNAENALHYVAHSGSFRVLKSLIANQSPQVITDCASRLDSKKKFPEDLALNPRGSFRVRPGTPSSSLSTLETALTINQA
eukprot:gene11654-13070_t